MTLPRLVIRRIVIIGDTGCRLKASAKAYQACHDPRAWPFALIARRAAAMHPDVVLHVGDYHYRENSCRAGNAGCATSPWGYGWDAWNADFFTPAAPLLDAAPWAVVRGNHEECARAGQGWWLLVDPHPLVAGADCVSSANDFAGNHSDPYAIELGGHARLIIADFAAIGEKRLQASQDLARYQADAAAINALAIAGDTNFVTDHYPFGAITVNEKNDAQIGFASIADAFGPDDRVPTLPNVAAVLSGHLHFLQIVQARNRPLQVVTGFSGTQEDDPRAPFDLRDMHSLPDGLQLVDLVTRFGRFGFATLDRQANGEWRLTARMWKAKSSSGAAFARAATARIAAAESSARNVASHG